MKIISWNVNGIRAVAKKGFFDFLKKEKPEILCLQEVKISDSAREKEEFDFPGYKEYWNSAERPGYSGTAILLSKKLEGRSKHTPSPSNRGNTPPTPLKRGINNGIGIDKFDKEGRVQTLELDKFYLVNAYFPNANHELSRLDYKLEFNDALLKHIKKLESRKPVIICGDFNVAHEEIDLARPKDNVGNPGFTDEEREWMKKYLKSGFVDTFRHFYPKKIQYSWWSYRFNARAKNIGWRIDYFLVSDKLIKGVKKAYILDKITGSDHCPVGLGI